MGDKIMNLTIKDSLGNIKILSCDGKKVRLFIEKTRILFGLSVIGLMLNGSRSEIEKQVFVLVINSYNIANGKKERFSNEIKNKLHLHSYQIN